MYLREMGSVELLSREGEIAIAKRIEAGREAMIAGLCESPLTFQAIIIWRDELVEGRVLLRDIIDLEATYAGPDGKGAPTVDRTPARARRRSDGADAGEPRATARRATPPEATSTTTTWRTTSRSRPWRPSSSRACSKPSTRIADNYKKLRRLQVEHVEQRMQNKQLTPAQERKYKKLKDDIVTRREVAVAQQQPHRGAGRAALRHQQAPHLATRAA